MDVKFSFNLQRLVQHVKENNFGIVSAFLGNLSKKENIERHKELKSKVKAKGYGYKELKGFWKGESGELEEEYSLFIPKVSFDDIKDLGKEYKQEAVVYGSKDEIVLYDTKANTVIKEFTKTETNAQAAWTSYSKLKNKAFKFSSVDWYCSEPHKRDSHVGAMLNEAWFDLRSWNTIPSEEDERITLTKKAHTKLQE